MSTLLNQYDKQSPNRLFIDALAIALSSDIIGDTTTYLPISRTFISQGLGLMVDSIL